MRIPARPLSNSESPRSTPSQKKYLEAHGHDPAYSFAPDVDWSTTGLAAQPFLGVPAERRPGIDSSDRSSSLLAGVCMRKALISFIVGALLLSIGCSQQDTEKTKQQAAQAAAKLKEESKTAAVELKKDAKEAAKQTKAAAEGIKQGLETPDKPVNVNSASKVQLQTLPGVDEETAGRIIAGRPYHTRDEVGARGVVSPEEFNAIKGKISVR